MFQPKGVHLVQHAPGPCARDLGSCPPVAASPQLRLDYCASENFCPKVLNLRQTRCWLPLRPCCSLSWKVFPFRCALWCPQGFYLSPTVLRCDLAQMVTAYQRHCTLHPRGGAGALLLRRAFELCCSMPVGRSTRRCLEVDACSASAETEACVEHRAIDCWDAAMLCVLLRGGHGMKCRSPCSMHHVAVTTGCRQENARRSLSSDLEELKRSYGRAIRRPYSCTI